MTSTTSPESLPEGIFACYLTGDFKLTRAPHHIDDQGRAVFYFNHAKLDWSDVVESARLQMFGNLRDPAMDARYAAVMAARAKRERAAA